jgi:hypothetical protein
MFLLNLAEKSTTNCTKKRISTPNCGNHIFHKKRIAENKAAIVFQNKIAY